MCYAKGIKGNTNAVAAVNGEWLICSYANAIILLMFTR